MQLEIELATHDLVTEEAGGARLFQRFLEAVVIGPNLAMNIVVANRDTHRVGADRHAFDQGMRVVANDVAILECARFAFIRIAHQVFLSRKLARHEAPLQAGRKTGAAASTQRRCLQFCYHLLRRDLVVEYALQGLIAAALDVVRQTPVLAIEAGQDQGFDVTGMQAGHFFSSSTSASIFWSDIQLHIRLLLTSMTGASPQAPMHSPSIKVNCPSAVVSR